MATTPTYDGNGADLLTTIEVRENIEEAIRGSSQFGDEANLAADKVLGQLIDPFSEQLGLAYELLQSIIDARNPETAEGVQLDSVAEIAGVLRKAATASTVTLTMDVDIGTTVTAGSRARVPSGTIFAIDEDVVGDGTGTQLVGSTATLTGALEAAAGTGKTTSMLDRMVALLETGACKIDTLAAEYDAPRELARRAGLRGGP